MLAPPPEVVGSRDKGALDEAGRERYLSSLERRLGKLEGRVGRKSALTSKDILQSLSEARDDHIMQPRGTDVDRNGPLSSGLSSSGRESPFSIKNEFADVDLGEGGGDGDNVMVVSGRRERVVVEGDVRPAGGSSIWTCCLGGGGRRGYRRAAAGGYDGDEEGSRLVDCDELSLEWQSQDINDVT